jgi:hypothetical protein
MDITHQDLVDAFDRLNAIGMWPLPVLTSFPLDRSPAPDGHCGLEIDRKPVFTFPDRHCLAWAPA